MLLPHLQITTRIRASVTMKPKVFTTQRQCTYIDSSLNAEEADTTRAL